MIPFMMEINTKAKRLRLYDLAIANKKIPNDVAQ